MGFIIEPIDVECIMNEERYVGRVRQRRYVVVDDETFEIIADKKGQGYKNHRQAVSAYYWWLYGPSRIKRVFGEREKIYEWSLKNRIFLDTLHRTQDRYEEEGKQLTASTIKKIFIANNIQCPSTPAKFLDAYLHGFYKEEIEKKRKRQAQFDRIRSKARLKSGRDDALIPNEKFQGLNFKAAKRIKNKLKEKIDNHPVSKFIFHQDKYEFLLPNEKDDFDVDYEIEEDGPGKFVESVIQSDVANAVAELMQKIMSKPEKAANNEQPSVPDKQIIDDKKTETELVEKSQPEKLEDSVDLLGGLDLFNLQENTTGFNIDDYTPQAEEPAEDIIVVESDNIVKRLKNFRLDINPLNSNSSEPPTVKFKFFGKIINNK